MRHIISALSLLSISVLLSCSGGDAGGNNVTDRDATGDATDGGLSEIPDGDDDDRFVRPDTEGLAGPGEECTDDMQCASFLCFRFVPGVDEGICTSYCFDAIDCADETWDCVYVRNTGGDITSLCVPQDMCIDEDDDGYGMGPGCDGLDCDETRSDVNTGEDEVCDGFDNDCDGNIDENTIDANLDCETGFSGPCAEGRTLCLGGFISCEPSRVPTEELCDLVDNDCDGATDESDDGTPIAEPCYGGPPATLGVGACASGVRACDAGQFTACLGQVLPFAEACDGIDNDCDGTVDQDDPEGGLPCSTGAAGACGPGITRCDGGAVVCDARTASSEEICDGEDNDCDGETDEDGDGAPLARACYDGPEGTLGVGLCADGTQTCEDGEFGRCIDDVLPEPELCDSLDNDCNGDVDEGNPAGGFVCSTGLLGVCARGVTACSDEGNFCDAIIEPTAEVCDGLDNDCDGEVDEGDAGAPLTRTCYEGTPGTLDIGTCHAGLQTCSGGDFGACVDDVLPASEICDGLDNDCDGAADNGNPGGGFDCNSGLLGTCAPGTTQCIDSSVTCVARVSPASEICDGQDNDCDGETDEDPSWADLRTGCTAGLGLCTQSGVRICDVANPAGPTVCSATPGDAEVEVCDGRDNDCDGETDEDAVWDSLGSVCYAGAGVCQRAGVRVCDPADASAAPTCSAEAGAPEDEVCDGLDNDCDGDTDEEPAWADLGDGCTSGVGACVAAGARICDPANPVGPTICSATPGLPTDELCDGVDNDCDGGTDEGALWADLRSGCTGGLGLCVASGVKVCDPGDAAGPTICSATPGAAEPEICDGLDNDCDGFTDEDVAWADLREGCTSGLGICVAAGVRVCDPADPAGPTVCSAAPLPSATEVCDGLDNDCDGSTDEDPIWADKGVGCTAGLGICVAAGVRICDPGAPAGPTICSATPASSQTELCNGLDDDCDGATDEDPIWADLSDVCSEGVGACVAWGVRICNSMDPAGPTDCSAVPAAPTTEVCDGQDNDCNGSTDEGALWADRGDGCTAGVGVCMGAGVRACNQANPSGPTICTANAGTPQTEICDGFDNDCDGSTDEDAIWSSLGGVCFAGQGVCQRAGVEICNAADPAGPPVCNATAGASSTEVCDGLDNDCDGSTDEGASWANKGTVCSVGLGVCQASGVYVCNSSNPAGATVCSAAPGASSTEVCDGLDNDCDGSTDEGASWASKGDVCSVGLGVCQASGVYICNSSNPAGALVCSATLGPSSGEVCDALDNDCDGSTDEGAAWTNKGAVCTVGAGICQRSGVYQCDPGSPGGPLVCSVSPGASATEICDGLDNDCDASTDEGALWSNKGTVCTVGTGECRRSGTYICNTANPPGATVCSATAGSSSTEICDGLDNDCNGTNDNGVLWANLGQICTSGVGACQRAGNWICNSGNPSGASVCNATPGSAGAETCNLVDDDCDGTVDDGFQTAGVYNTNSACGNCYTNCTTIYAKPNAYGTCNTSGTPTCQMNCNAGYYDLNAVPADGCEFLLDSTAIYVSINDSLAADDVGCGLGPSATGGGRHPCRSITQGIVRAQSVGRTRVLVAAGSYTATVTLVNGVSLLGGYNAVNWSRDWAANPTAIFGNTASGHRKTVIAQNINSSATLFEGFAVYGQNATGSGQNSYALWVSNCDSDLTVRNNTFVAGTGGPGTGGAAGTAGSSGGNGTAGGSARETGSANCAAECNSGMEVAGGAGGANTCGGTSTAGGAGGRGRCPDYEENVNECASCPSGGATTQQTRNTDGSGGANGGGSGGFGGCDSLIDGACSGYGCSCYQPNDSDCSAGMAAFPGVNGSSGGSGAGGSACVSTTGSVSGGEWTGASGGNGSAGTHGGGGGGGGAGGGVETFYSSTCASSSRSDIGGSGGGGGAGGCGGTGGTGGSAGGGSFAIFVVFSAAPGANIPSISGNSIQRSFGGNGGTGGNGGIGGAGGRGANGGAGGLTGSSYWCAAGGQKGGEGGAGGHAGGGGGGCGGVSYGIFSSGQGGANLSAWNSGNTFLSGGGGGAGGAGGGTGPGGNSGGTGSAGASANSNF